MRNVLYWRRENYFSEAPAPEVIVSLFMRQTAENIFAIINASNDISIMTRYRE